MHVSLSKFGTTLVSRISGKEAFLVAQPMLSEIPKKENIEIDFEGVLVLSPGWADEFITPLKDIYKEKIILVNTENPSVKATLITLEKAKKSQ